MKRDFPAEYACAQVDALGPGAALDVRLEGFHPGVRCDPAQVKVLSDAGVTLEPAQSDLAGQGFANVSQPAELSDGCRGTWELELVPVTDDSDPFQEPTADGPPGLLVTRTFTVDRQDSRCAARARDLPSCGDAWASSLGRK